MEEAIRRDGATFLSKENGLVYFICKCGENGAKQKGAICKTSGAFCVDCTSKNTAMKRIRGKIALNNRLLEGVEPPSTINLMPTPHPYNL